MDLLSAFKRKKPTAPQAVDGVQVARTRARQRLIGAAVLIVVGIIGFPLLFETQPRPVPVDLPIDIPPKEGAPPLVLSPAPAAPTSSRSPAATKPDSAGERVINETSADAGRELAPAASAASAPTADAAVSPPQTTKQSAAEEKHKPAPATPIAPKPANKAADDGARARALLEGTPGDAGRTSAPTADALRFVVQVGAFTDPAAVKAARAKVERLGLVTYTQVAETSAGARTRVRVGPFATRAEAERAAARIKAVDLPTVILTL